VSEQAKPTHTPRPWHTVQGGTPNSVADGDVIEIVTDDHETLIADVHFVATDDQWWANARLIAAAPDLLAELTETATWLDERADVLVQLLADPAGWGRGQAATDKRQAIREEIARLRGRAFLIRQLIDKATTQGA
jgi:hypothetical protein